MRRLSTPLATAIAAVLGCAAFVALLPWGDPWSFAPQTGGVDDLTSLSSLQENIRNASFLILCLAIGFVTGLLTRSRRFIAGALSPPLAALVAHFAAHWLYGIEWPQPAVPWTPSRVLITVAYFAVMAAVGLVGAALSRYVRLTTASSAA
jgi:hypothetical protein